MKNNKISIVIGTYNRYKFLKLSIESVRKEMINIQYEIIVIDGGSTDNTLKWLKKQKDIITIIQYNRGTFNRKVIERRSWGYFMNLGFKCAESKYVCMLSDDCLVVPGAIMNGYILFEEKLSRGEKVGAMAFYWRNWPEQEKYNVGLTLGGKMFVNHGLYLKTALEEVNYIDESYNFYHADGDLCLKLWNKGYSCIDSPNSYVEHYSHANIKVRKSNEIKQKNDWANYLDKWTNIFYNPKNEYWGEWIKKEYSDKLKTFNKFKRVNILKYIILFKIKKNFKKIILKKEIS